jgi:hypothetical protein
MLDLRPSAADIDSYKRVEIKSLTRMVNVSVKVCEKVQFCGNNVRKNKFLTGDAINKGVFQQKSSKTYP